jgi:hypothetical protein
MSSKNLKNLRKDFEHALTAIKEYEKKLKGWQSAVKLDKKNIEMASIEQSSYLAYYDEIKVELKIIMDYFDHLLKKQKAEDMKALMENAKRSMSDRMIEKLAEESRDYNDIYMIYLEIKELYMMACSIVDQFQQRGYALNNIIKIREKELEGVTLHLDE